MRMHFLIRLPEYVLARIKDQGSRIKDRMVVENALGFERKSPFSAYSRPYGQQAVEYQRKYCRKMETNREKQKKQHSHR